MKNETISNEMRNKRETMSIIDIYDDGKVLEVDWHAIGLNEPVASSFMFENRSDFYETLNILPHEIESLLGKSFSAKIFKGNSKGWKVVPKSIRSLEEFNKRRNDILNSLPAPKVSVVEVKDLSTNKFIQAEVVKSAKKEFVNASENAKKGHDKRLILAVRAAMQNVLDREHVKTSYPETYDLIKSWIKELD